MPLDGKFRRNWRAQELSGCRSGLFVVHTLVCLTRLWPIYLALVRNNPAIIWSFTVGPDDYDVGVEGVPPVTHEEVVRVFTENNEKLRNLLFAVIPSLPDARECACATALTGARFEV